MKKLIDIIGLFVLTLLMSPTAIAQKSVNPTQVVPVELAPEIETLQTGVPSLSSLGGYQSLDDKATIVVADSAHFFFARPQISSCPREIETHVTSNGFPLVGCEKEDR